VAEGSKASSVDVAEGYERIAGVLAEAAARFLNETLIYKNRPSGYG
jgi:hypothetical protein